MRSIAVFAVLLVLTAGCDGDPDVLTYDVLLPADTLRAPTPVEGDGFGSSIAQAGDVLVVGARGRSQGAGGADVFVREGGQWRFETALTPTDGRPQEFGRTVATDGERIVVGAPFRDNLAGAAYVFGRTASGWALEAELVLRERFSRTFFGWAVAVDNGVALIGAPNDFDQPSSPGAAYVFEAGNEGWAQTDSLTASDSRFRDAFGIAVDIDAGRIAVGATTSSSGNRSAYVFDRDGVDWRQTARLSGGQTEPFGASVSLSGDLLAVGAPGNTPEGGVAYVFRASGSDWEEEDRLAALDEQLFRQFGTSVSVSGTRILVGAPDNEQGRGPGRGVGYLFERSGGDWNPLSRLELPADRETDLLGQSVVLDGVRPILAAPVSDVGEGRVYTFGE
ncbi:MAG: hypothetical protein AAGI08_01550 [Bacteroidota bacterium]